jgi:DNA adenine methylase
MVVTSNVTRNPVKWSGGKWRLSKWILETMEGIPHTIYCEPFGGGASVLLRKPHSPRVRDVYNDLDGDIVNFFTVLRDREDELVRAIALTPYAEEEWRLSYQPSEDPLERARRTYVRLRQSYPGDRQAAFHKGGAGNGWLWKHSDGAAFYTPGLPDTGVLAQWQPVDYMHAAAARLRQVEINNNDWREVVKRYDGPGTLFYVDPPYLKSATRGSDMYLDNMTPDDHRELAEWLNAAEGMSIVSGYPSPLYEELYAGWGVATRGNRDARQNATTEVLWLSPNISRYEQRELFGGGVNGGD